VVGQLFPELEPQGPDQKRSWYVSKRFTIYRRASLGDSDEVDFRQFRRCFATYLERAQGISGAVYSSVIDELMGRKKQTWHYRRTAGDCAGTTYKPPSAQWGRPNRKCSTH
jgi:hypothetical protein